MRARRHGLAALCGAFSGATGWTSLGRLAVDTSAGAPHFMGLLPPLAWLGVASIAGAAIAVLTTTRGVSVGLFLVPLISAVAWTTLTASPALVAWAGPAAIVPLALVVLGILRHGAPAWRPSSRSSPWLAALGTAFALGAILLTSSALTVTGDEPHYLLATQSLLTDADLDLTNNYDDETYRAYYFGRLEPRHIASGVLNQEFSFHGPGVSVLVLPGFALAGALGARLTIILIAAIGAGFFWAAAHRVTGSRTAAWVGCVAMVSSAPFAFQGVTIYPDGLGAAITSIALWGLVMLSTETTVGVTSLVGVSLALAMLPWLHIRLSSSAAALGLALLLAMSRRRRDLMPPFMAAPVISFVLWIASTWVMFGTIDPTAVFRQKAGGSLAAMPKGVLGLLFDAEFGLLIYAPIMAIAILGIPALVRRSPLVGVMSSILTAATLAIGGAWIWWGGDSPPARFLAPILPLFCLWLAVWWTGALAGARVFAATLIVLGACLTCAMAFAEHGRYIINFADGRGTIFDWLSPNSDVTLALPSLFRTGATPSSEAAFAAMWTSLAASAFALTSLAQRRRAISSGTCWLLGSSVTVAWITAGLALGWWWRGMAPWTPDRGQQQLLYASVTPALTVGLLGPSPQFVSRDRALSASSIALPLTGTPVALHMPFVPAGRYALDVAVAPNTAAAAQLRLELGRDAATFAAWPAHDVTRAPTFSLALPTYLVRVVGDDVPPPAVRLRPLSVVASPPIADVALRATRYGTLVVYALDSYSYPERDGFWLAGDRTGRVLIADLNGRAVSHVMTFAAHDAAVVVHLEQGTFRRTVTVAPHTTERLLVEEDGDNIVAPLGFTVSGSASVRAGDGRRLGVFVGVAPQ